ncbi:zinc finger protein 845-like [Mytilus trossulus]|uniref:zinc finger protein 845-like n=1 Tax=Mytilus trossulus TaxID=6551 RepID=UPI003007D018
MDEDDDMHICLVCQATVVGLINYVNHKKYECPGRKNADKGVKTAKPVQAVSQPTYTQGEPATQSFMQLLSPTDSQYSQSPMFASHIDSPAQITTSQQFAQSPLHTTSQLFSVSSSPSHGVGYTTQISFSDEIGPVMSLQQNTDLPSPPASGMNHNDKVSTSQASIEISPIQTNRLSSSPSQGRQPLTVDPNEQYLTLPSGGFSPSGNVMNPNVVMSPEGSDFFSSLALQKKSEKVETHQNENKDSLTADLPIANILNSLDLYDEDLDFVFADDNFLQDAFTDESDDDSFPPPNHTHGKWKPGEGPSHHSKVLWQPGRRPMHPSKGKWRPGEMPGKAKGKLKSHILARQQENAKEEEEKNQTRVAYKKRNEYKCQYCDITFSNRFVFSSHCQKPEHKRNVSNYDRIEEAVKSLDVIEWKNDTNENNKKIKLDNEIKEERSSPDNDNREALDENKSVELEKPSSEVEKKKHEPPVYICSVCDKKFDSKYTMARHLLSTYHKNRITGNPDTIKVLEQYHKYIVWLSPYQCTICQFYFNRNDDFMEHLKSEDHKLQCEGLDGEIMCSTCKFSCHDNGSLLRHIENNGIHKQAAKKGNKPCIIKEKNYDTVCKYCKKRLHSKLHMKRHMRSQHFKEYAEYESTCKLCDKFFFDTYTYKRHMATGQHKLRAEQRQASGNAAKEEKPEVFNEGVNRTRINRKVEKPYKLAKKNTKSINKSFKCEYCDFVASQYNELRPHYMESHANHVFVCELCDLTFITEKARKVHFAGIKHQTNLRKSEGNPESLILQCDYCDRRFEDEKLKLFHTEVYHLHPNSEESLKDKLGRGDVTTLMYRDFLSTIDQVEDERIQCLECPKTIMKDYILEHLRSHSGDKPYKCRYCSSGFAAPLSLRRHLMSHVGLADRKCEICGKEFKKYGSYREHMTKHCLEENNASKLICDVCGQEFLLQKQLTTHMRRHGEKKFKCTYEGCRWAFYLYNELKAHYRSHTGERAYLCDICGYAAGTKNRLNRHHHTHTGERAHHCEYCNYKAGTRTHLRRHMRIHIGSKPYKCPYCPYSCNTHENIRKHISKTKKHAGLPIYPCKFCDYGTSNTVDFRFHLEQKHKGEFNFKASDGLAIIAGLYKKDDDPAKPLEGTEIFQVRERKIKTERQPRQKQKKQPIHFVDTKYDIPEENKIEVAQYQVNNEDFHNQTEIVDVHVTHEQWPAYTTQAKITPISSDMQSYQNVIEPSYSGQISSVGYFMPVTTPSNTVTVESSLIPQPPALQVDVVANGIKFHYD